MPYFQGDGRVMLRPTHDYPGCRSMCVRTSAANRMVESFLKGGSSSHSGSGSTLWVILRYCHETRTEYNLRVHPGYGYYVTLINHVFPAAKETSS